MKTFIGVISMLFGALFINITINQFEKAGNVMLTHGVTLWVLGFLVLINRGISNGRIYTRVIGIGVAMILFGIAFILKPGDAGSGFGILIIVMGSFFSIADYLETKG